MTDTALPGAGPPGFDPVPAFRFDTRAMSAGHDVDLWRGIMDEFYDVVPLPGQRDQPFAATMTTWNLGGVLLNSGIFTEQRFSRSARRARRDGFDPYTVLLHRSGQWRADTGAQIVESKPDGVSVLDFGRPVVSEVTLNDSITVTFPREFLDDVLPPRDLHGLSLDGTRGGILRDFMISVADRLPGARASDAALLGAALRDVMAACVAPSLESAAKARPQLDALAYRRARSLIDANLHRADWGAEELRLALGVSRSTLYRVFERVGGVAEHIRSRRLARAHVLLARSQGRQRVSEIGRLCGFTSEAHFSRAFKQAYGYTAREAMAYGGSGLPLNRQNAIGSQSGQPDVIDWIRSLRG